jgi:hypothetical protein
MLRPDIAETPTGSPNWRDSIDGAPAPGRPPMTLDAVHPLGDEKRHYWLALGMAQASGADLQRALDEGRITHGDWAEVVTRCRGCGWTEGCDCWLAAQDGETSASVPQACPNAAFFETVLSGGNQPDDPSNSS